MSNLQILPTFEEANYLDLAGDIIGAMPVNQETIDTTPAIIEALETVKLWEFKRVVTSTHRITISRYQLGYAACVAKLH